MLPRRLSNIHASAAASSHCAVTHACTAAGAALLEVTSSAQHPSRVWQRLAKHMKPHQHLHPYFFTSVVNLQLIRFQAPMALMQWLDGMMMMCSQEQQCCRHFLYGATVLWYVPPYCSTAATHTSRVNTSLALLDALMWHINGTSPAIPNTFSCWLCLLHPRFFQ
jgi:hypothetical protein